MFGYATTRPQVSSVISQNPVRELAGLIGENRICTEHFGVADYPLAEVVDEHDVAVLLVDLGIEDVAAIGRDGQSVVEVFVQCEDFADFLGGEIEITQRLWRIRRNQINTSCNVRLERSVDH